MGRSPGRAIAFVLVAAAMWGACCAWGVSRLPEPWCSAVALLGGVLIGWGALAAADLTAGEPR